MMQQLYELLLKQGRRIASCESITGGLFMAEMTSVPHVSRVFMGGVVSYQNEIKEKVVGVPVELVDTYGVVSAECAQSMATNICRLFMADVGVSFTGNAGPTAMEGKPAGLVYTCIVVDGQPYPFHDQIDMPRNQLRQKIVDLTVARLKEILTASRKDKGSGQ